MTVLTFFSVAAAWLVLLDSAAATIEDNRTVTLKDETTCLDIMNEARKKAKLTLLREKPRQEAGIQEDGKPEGIWDHVCKNLLDDQPFQPADNLVSSGTYALFKLSELAEGQDVSTVKLSDALCNDAVKEWQKGFDEFEDNPPVNEVIQYTGANSSKVSFVTLYNPRSDAAGYCSVVTCTNGPSRGSPKKTVSGLVCLTAPNAFGEDPLFEEDKWNNIKNALTPPEENEQKVTITDGNSCLTKLNAAREEAGLSALTPITTIFFFSATQTTASGVLETVCDSLLTGKEFKPSEELTFSGTFSVFKLNEEGEEGSVEKQQTTPTNAQCSAAVEEWQQGFKALKDDPPVDKGVKYSEANSTQVSFLTLYNPDSKAEGQCSVATCTVSKDTGDNREEKTVSGLVCSTTPNVFGKESLFTQNQWDSIKDVLSSSASAAIPPILALACLLVASLVS